MTKQGKPTVVGARMAGEDHVVVSLSVAGGATVYRREPCTECPWVVANDGLFPAEAFKHSASTSYDAAQNTFACHSNSIDNSAICAGFLLRNAVNNLAVRVKRSQGLIDPDQVHSDGRPLHASYKEMAIANGVDPDDPILAQCRADDE